MDVSASDIVLGIVVLMGAVGAAYGARWVSRRSDEQMERTRAALRARHAVPDLPPEPVTPPRPPAPVPGTADEDPESSGRHRVPDELMRAVTYTLSPDRVARARVPGPRPQQEAGRLTERRG